MEGNETMGTYEKLREGNETMSTYEKLWELDYGNLWNLWKAMETLGICGKRWKALKIYGKQWEAIKITMQSVQSPMELIDKAVEWPDAPVILVEWFRRSNFRQLSGW